MRSTLLDDLRLQGLQYYNNNNNELQSFCIAEYIYISFQLRGTLYTVESS